MTTNTIICLCVPMPNREAKISGDATTLIKRRLEDAGRYLTDGTVRVFVASHRHAIATGGIVAQALHVGQVERIPQLSGNGTDQSAEAIRYLTCGPLSETANRAETVIIIADQINIGKLAVELGRELFRQRYLEEIQLLACQMRIISNDPLKNTVIPTPHERRTRRSANSAWGRSSPSRW